MKLTVLIDNNTLVGKEYLGEPALSLYIEENGKNVLFDLGYTDAYIRNANKMGIAVKKTDIIAFSHGHLDHTWGFTSLLENIKPSRFSDADNLITVLAHPLAFSPKAGDGGPAGFIFSLDALSKYFNFNTTRDPYWISDNLCFLGEIPRCNDFENQRAFGKIIAGGSEEEDYLLDDTALAYKAEDGLVIITGCSHSGICNIVERAKKVCGEDRILDIIGGFHLLDPVPEQLEGTLDYMKSLDPQKIHPCHCTDLKSKIALAGVVRVEEAGVGTIIEYK